MLFSSPDYPLFLLAVFFLYALARWGAPMQLPARLARIGVMVLLGDLVVMLIAKNPDALWDPLGGILYRLLADDPRWAEWSVELVWHWLIGSALLVVAIAMGAQHGRWIASKQGQAWIARGLVAVLAILAVLVYWAWWAHRLDDVTLVLVEHAHLVVLAVLGIALGASLDDVHRPIGRVIILFVASALFYHAWAAGMPGAYRYLLGLLLSTIVLDYYLGIWIEQTEDPTWRRVLLVVSLCSNLGILFFFKYYDFFAHDVLGSESKRLNLILPAGISFHTFQSLSYTIDVYRRELKATRSVISFATFVLFFPQLVAGPIVRAQDLLPQLESPPPLDLEKATVGLYRIGIGLFKKIAIADTLALSIVDRVFENPGTFSSLEVAVGIMAYALQIFCDFAAYSDIAIGSAQLLGFTMPENFRTPYRSANLQEFWRRWHISLSTWLRDYLYVTLGGNRRGAVMTYVNLTLTMLLGGLWHGASWAFIVWGALHGLGLAVTRYFQRATAGKPKEAWSLLVGCAIAAVLGVALIKYALPTRDIWWQLAFGWIFLTPLWAVITAWLGRDEREAAGPSPLLPFAATLVDRRAWRAELVRYAMCASAIAFFCALQYGQSWTWIPLVVVTWGLGIAGDVADGSLVLDGPRIVAIARRAIAVALTFSYVCLAWVFFRAQTFGDALAVLRQLPKLEFDHANLVPLVTVPLAAGFATHFFADGGYRWLRQRFCELPQLAQGAVLAAAALVLRELSHPTIVPFIYFQF